MVNPIELKTRMLNLMAIKGPMLPMQFVKELQINSILVGALLSELLKDRKIKLSNMRVGGSPLYLLDGQEIHLEKFSNYLPGKEREALSLLKNNQLLRDIKQEPAIRVALRSIKDFAKPFNFQTELFWRYFTLSEQETEILFKQKFPEFFMPIKEEKREEPKQKEELKQEEAKVETSKSKDFDSAQKSKISDIIEIREKLKEKFEEKKPEISEDEEEEQEEEEAEEGGEVEEEKEETEKPLLKIRHEKPARDKPDSEFVIKVKNFLKDSEIEILEEKEKKKKDFIARIKVSSSVGKIEFICIAKEKKKITENDLSLALQKAQSEKAPILLLSTGEPDKKAEVVLKSVSIIKFKRI